MSSVFAGECGIRRVYASKCLKLFVAVNPEAVFARSQIVPKVI